MEAAGYGISGHTNAYSSKVRVGNWVEDGFGAELARGKKRLPLQRHTEASFHFQDPAARAGGGPLRPRERVAGTEGLEHSTLVAHCEKGNVHSVSRTAKRFSSTHDASFTMPGFPGRGEGVLGRRKAMQQERCERASAFATTASIMGKGPFQPQARGRQAGSPPQRHVPSMDFSKSFVQALEFSRLRKGLDV